MSTLTPESFVTEYPKLTPYPVPFLLRLDIARLRLGLSVRKWRVSLQTPVYQHDRTIVTVVVLLCGTGLLALYGDSSPIVALVSSGWTLALTFWFRFSPYPEGTDQRPDNTK